jgi:uncharacterized protein YukE
MADFAIWVSACEAGLGWPEGTFLAAYTENRSSANETAMEASLVGVAAQQFMAEQQSWQGTSTELLAALEDVVDEKTQHRRDWPKTPRKLSGDLRRVAPNLRRAGLDVIFSRGAGKNRKRFIMLAKADGSDEATTNAGEDRPTAMSLPGMELADSSDGSDGIARTIEDLDTDQRAEWEERVAVCTIDGGLSHTEAEETAWQQIGQTVPEQYPA